MSPLARPKGRRLFIALGWLGLALFNFANRDPSSLRSFDRYGWIGLFLLSVVWFYLAFGPTKPERPGL